jgi:uncharacterized protein (TIGR04255 family)
MGADDQWFPTLRRAPIVEALLDIWVANPPSVTPQQLELLHKDFEQEYPNIDKIPFPHFQPAVMQSEKSGIAALAVRGFRFSARDGETMVQSRIDGFTFNNIGHYKDWEFFSTRAIEAWKKYRRAFGEGPITKIALKYVNLIRCPLDQNQVVLEEYFTVAPKAPLVRGLPMSNFLSQVQLDAPGNMQCLWTFTRHLPPEPDFFKVLIDIDVSVQEPSVLRQETVESLLPKMRTLKNQLFFHSLTAKGLHLFQ